MSTRSPKDRLSKLFRKSGSHHQDNDRVVTPSPPTSPSSPGPQRELRKSTSRKSLRNALHSRGPSLSKKRASTDYADDTPAVPSAPLQQQVSPETHHYAGVAAARAMNVDQPHRIPSLPRESDLSADLRDLTLSSSAGGKQPFSEDVADRNIARHEPEEINSPALQAGYEAQSKRLDLSAGGGGDGFDSSYPTTRRRSLSRKADVSDFKRGTVDTAHAAGATAPARSPRRSVDTTSGIARRSLDKPLPRSPSDEYAREFANDRVLQRQSGAPDLAKQLNDIIDPFTNTEDYTVHERYAPAVTHETIERRVHHIREEQITREIHNHHVFHRVLPIIDIEVLPARHFVPVEGGYAEISEDEVPGRTGPNAQWVIAETVSKLLPESKGPVVPTQFTARSFEGTDGDYQEYVGEDGIKRTETWWVHPPTWEDGGRQTGQTYPFYIGSPNPEENGLRARLPEKKILGVSPLLAQQQRERMSAQQQAQHNNVQSGQGPPVPQHKTFPAEMVDAARSQPPHARNYSRP